jgi:FMN phosphatase YigB (HAD superfamily)
VRKAARDTVVFDVGGVLIDWDPRHLYRKLFGANEAAMEHFSPPSARTNGAVARMPAGPLPKAPAC